MQTEVAGFSSLKKDFDQEIVQIVSTGTDKAISIGSKGRVFLSTKDNETSKSTIIRRIAVCNIVIYIAHLKAISSGQGNVRYTFQGFKYSSLNLSIRAKDGKMIAHKVRNCTRDPTYKKDFFCAHRNQLGLHY